MYNPVTSGQNPVLETNTQLTPNSRKSKFLVLGFKPQSKNPAGFKILVSNIVTVKTHVKHQH